MVIDVRKQKESLLEELDGLDKEEMERGLNAEAHLRRVIGKKELADVFLYDKD